MQFRQTAFAAMTVAVMSCASPVLATTYIIDKENTQVAFSWDRVGLTRQMGRFTDVSGTVEFEPETPESGSVDVTIRAASVQTGVTAFDRNLRSPDFFDATSFPVITFKSSTVTRTGDKTGEVTGDLTMLGVTKPVTLQVTWVFTGEHPFAKLNAAYRDKTVSVFSAKGVVKRSDWGLSRVIPYIADEITIAIEAELIKK